MQRPEAWHAARELRLGATAPHLHAEQGAVLGKCAACTSLRKVQRLHCQLVLGTSAQTAGLRELGLTLLGEPREASDVFAYYLVAIIAVQCMLHARMYSGVLFTAKSMENFAASIAFPLRSKCQLSRRSPVPPRTRLPWHPTQQSKRK